MRVVGTRIPTVGEDRKIYSTADSTATAGQTVFVVSYDEGKVAVWLNGIRLVQGQDFSYTASGVGSQITLSSGIAANDFVEVVGYQGIYSGNALVEDRFVVGTSSTGSGGSYTNSTTVFPVASNTGDLVCVYRNGIKLVHTTDFVVSASASTVTLQSASNTADEITVHVIGVLQHSNFLSASGGTVTGTLNVSGGTLTTSTAQKTAIVDGGKGNLTKSDVGLGNVDNTADSAKPVSTATQTALNAKAPSASPTFTGAVTVPAPSASSHAARKADVDALTASDVGAIGTSASFGGDVSGTYNAIVVADDSHNHVVSNIDGLSTTLNAVKPSILEIVGAIIPGATSTLTINGSCFDTTNVSVEYKEGSTVLTTVTGITPTSSGVISTTTPSQVYNQSAGDTISIRVFNNGDSSVASNTVTKQLSLPTGGTRTNISGSTYQHVFNSSQTFSTDLASLSVQYLVVGGGGGGGIGYSGGGGGGGGFRTNVSGQTSGGGSGAEGSMTISNGDYSVVVGSGGGAASNGSQSSFNGVISLGGGGGGSFASNHHGKDGGSGGGACDKSSATQSGGSGTSGQGKNGGSCTTSGSPYSGGGGGGSSQNGTNGGPGTGNGGNGQSSSLTSSSYSGGGGGGKDNSGGATSGGTGGGGAGTYGSGTPTAGGVNTGGGGGGGYPNNVQGANGGSGIVIIRYTL